MQLAGKLSGSGDWNHCVDLADVQLDDGDVGHRGNKAGAPDWGSWKLLSFGVSGTLSNYVRASDGAIMVQLLSNNAKDVADIDLRSSCSNQLIQYNSSTAKTPPPPGRRDLRSLPEQTDVAVERQEATTSKVCAIRKTSRNRARC